MNAPKTLVALSGLLMLTTGLLVANNSSSNLPFTNSDTAVIAQSGPVSLSVRTDQTSVVYGDDSAYILVDVHGQANAHAVRTPVSIAIVVDASGSMRGEAIEGAREAAHDLVNSLNNGDRVSIVSYSDAATTHLANMVVGPDRSEAHRVISAIQPLGGTCISCGMEAAYNIAYAGDGSGFVSRVVMLSDGHANAGLLGVDQLQSLSNQALARGVTTSSAGLGQSYDAGTLISIAEGGNGAYYYLNEGAAISQVFSREFADLSNSVAQNLSVIVSPQSGVTFGQPDAIGYTWEGTSLRFNVGYLAAGTTRSYLIPVNLPHGELSTIANARVVFNDAAGVPQELAVSTALRRTSDAQAAGSSADAHVVERMSRLEAARDVEAAMARYADGDYHGARQDLRELADLLGDGRVEGYGALGGLGGLTGEAQEVEMLINAMDAAPSAGSTEGRSLVFQNVARGNEMRRGVPADEMYHDSAVR